DTHQDTESRGHHHEENELQGPQADVGDGEDVVVAHVDAAWLFSVAFKIFALVSPHSLSHSTEHCGVIVDPTDEVLQPIPVHDCWGLALRRGLAGKHKEPEGDRRSFA
uniref:Uncharacterized protein n=1 Tax=Neolamprologus brichardi TaxID=32507 RepID=A0A3Q4HVI7_NEOBR